VTISGANKETFLSVIIPTYNGEQFVAAALESLRGQEEGLEVLVVDDGSTDNTLEIVREFERLLSIRTITLGRLGNWVAASNAALREAASEWVCFLHQDDLWLPGRSARLRREMEKAEGALVLHNAMFIGPDGQCLGQWTCPLAAGDIASDLFVARLLVQNFIAIPSPVFRRSIALESGALDEALWFTADWDLWLRLGASGPVRFVNETLAAFRIHPQSQTIARKLQPNEWEQQLTAVLARHLPSSVLTAEQSASVEGVAMASVAVNCSMAAAARGEPAQAFAALGKFLLLGPSGWHQYLRDSRIVQRVTSRLRLKRLMKAKV
jgi:GT2 family glycosyltransferase